MLELKGLNENIKNEGIKNILSGHYHNLIINITGFIGVLLDDDLQAENNLWSKDFVNQIRDDICPYFCSDIDKQRDLIKSAFNKLYSDEILKTTAEENYVLARAISFGVVNEELAINELLKTNNYDALDKWLDSYKIENDVSRSKVESYIKAMGDDEPFMYRNYLEEIGGEFKEKITEHFGGSPVIEYENPNSSIVVLFTKDELALISAVQPENHQNNIEEHANSIQKY